MLFKPVLSDGNVLRPTYLEIDLNKIEQNYLAIQNHIGSKKIMAILKANAYGHGLVRIASHLEKSGIPYLGVAYLEEGIMLREAGIKTPILVLGGIVGEQIPSFIQYELSITASSIEKLIQIEECAQNLGKRAIVHLKIDTGMERIGVHFYSSSNLLEASLKCRHCHIEGIFTHFAESDSKDPSFTSLQLERFRKVLSFYDRIGIKRPLVHLENSGAILQAKDDLSDMVRPGLLLYGIYPMDPCPVKIDVHPAMSWKTKIVYFKVIEANHPVSYGGTWKSDQMTRIVTLPVGYGDGYFRAMSNKAQVLIRGKRYPEVGNICMDQMMINIGWDEAYNGEEVVLFGTQGNDEISVWELSKWAGTIPYEILTNINTRVPRTYIQD